MNICNLTNEYHRMIFGTALGFFLALTAFVIIYVFNEIHILLFFVGLVGAYYVYKMGTEDADRHKIPNLCCEFNIFAWLAGALHFACFIVLGVLSKTFVFGYVPQGGSMLNIPLFFSLGYVCLYIIHHIGLHGCKIVNILPFAVVSSISFVLCGAYISTELLV